MPKMKRAKTRQKMATRLRRPLLKTLPLMPRKSLRRPAQSLRKSQKRRKRSLNLQPQVRTKKEEGADEEESKDGFNAPKQDDDEKADKVDNEPEKEIDQEEDSANDETTQVTTTTATVSDNEEAEPVSKFMLLDRLFKFIESESEDQVNPVLAGYFSKVV